MEEIKQLYILEMTLHLKLLGITKHDYIVNQPECLEEDFKKDLKKYMLRMKSGNVDEKILDQAIAEIVPFLTIDKMS